MDAITTQSGNLSIVRVSKACAILDCGKTRLYELMREGEIEAIHDGKLCKVLVSSLHDYIERRRRPSEKAVA